MASKGTSLVKVRRQIRGFTISLKSAVCEWLLIGLMLWNAVISYFLTKFARYSGLQVPCILCSRLDHILGNERPGFYRNLLCGKHKSEISIMVACHIHGEIADGNGMCEECLFSFLLSTKADNNTDRALLCKIGYDPGSITPKSSLFNTEYGPAAVGTRLCSCCKKPWISRQITHKLFYMKSPRSDIPLPRRLTHRGNIRKMRDRFSKSGEPHHHLRKFGYDPMSHIGYSELKHNSDSESDFPYSDDDDLINIAPRINEENQGSNDEDAPRSSSKTLATSISAEVPHDSSKLGMHQYAGASGDVQCFIPELKTTVKLGGYDSKQTDIKKASSSPPELISLDDLPPSNDLESSVGVSSTKDIESKLQTAVRPYPSAISELMSLVEAPSLFHIPRSLVEASQKKDENGITDLKSTSTSKYEEIFKSLNTKVEEGIRVDKLANEVLPLNLSYMPFTNIQKPKFIGEDKDEPSTKNESLHAHVRSSPIVDVSTKDPEPSLVCKVCEMHGTSDGKSQMNGLSSSNEAQEQQEISTVEITKSSACESLDEGSISEVEAGSSIDQLKKRIEHDGNRISSLTAELEEERNASAIAANQAMAMITRLQEEKASLHMEALQYLRMMEEQAEYDVEALERANDLLAEREKEIQDMEAELDFLRLRLSESTSDVAPIGDSMLGEEMLVETHEISRLVVNDNVVLSNPMPNEESAGNEKGYEIVWSDFADEKSFIFKSLRELESRLRQFTSHPPSPRLSDNDSLEENEGKGNSNGGPPKEDIQVNGQYTETITSLRMGTSSPNESQIASISDAQVVGKGSNHHESPGQGSTAKSNGVDLVTIENELTDLNERLEALESNWYFLDHTINCLQSGKDGLIFIQDIAHQLQELRKIGLGTGCPSIQRIPMS